MRKRGSMKHTKLFSLKHKLIYSVALCAISNISLVSGSESMIFENDSVDIHRHTNAANRAIVKELDELAAFFCNESITLEKERLVRELAKKAKKDADRKSDFLNQDQAFELFQDHSKHCKSVSAEQKKEMEFLIKAIKISEKIATEGAKRRKLLKEAFLQKKAILPDQIEKFNEISTLFEKELTSLKDIDSKREKIPVRFISGWRVKDSGKNVVNGKNLEPFLEYVSGWTLKPDTELGMNSIETVWELKLRKDVLNIMNFKNTVNPIPLGLTVSSKVFMHVYRFFEAALTLRKNSMRKTVLLREETNKKVFQYFLFKPNHNVMEFLEENKDLIDTLITLELWNEYSQYSLFESTYEETGVTEHNRNNLIINQLRASFENRSIQGNPLDILTQLNKFAATTSPELSLAFGELTLGSNIDDNIIKDYNYLKNLPLELYQDLIDICQLINNTIQTNISTIFRQVQESLNKNLIHEFATYLRQNLNYMNGIHFLTFFHELKIRNATNRENLIQFLVDMRQRYRQPHGGRGNGGQSMEVHDASNQQVSAMINGQEKKVSFNDAVIALIKTALNVRCGYQTTQSGLKDIFQELSKQSNQARIFNQTVYEGMFKEIKEDTDKENLAIVYSYLKTKYNKDELIGWLHAFMEENEIAYSLANGKSCNKGINERIITSLRRAIPEDSLLKEVFQQGEIPLMFKNKKAQLSNIDSWVSQLYDAGIRTISTEQEAQAKLRELMIDFFEELRTPDNSKEIDESIENMTGDVFLSETDKNPGLWKASYLPKLEVIEKNYLHTRTLS